MPALVVSNGGERELLRLVLKAVLVTPRIWHLRVYVNDYTPNRDTVIGDLIEAAWPGYMAVPLDPATWMDPVTIGGVAVSYYGTDYTAIPATSGTTIAYGYYITFGADLLLSQRFDDPQTVTSTVPALVLPVLTGHSESQPAPPP